MEHVKTGCCILALVLCLNLFAVPVSGNLEFPIDSWVLHATYGPEFIGSYYVYEAEGRAYGAISGNVTWHEEGFVNLRKGWVVANLTTDDGRFFKCEFGRIDQPFTWHTVDKIGEIYKIYMEGPVYVNGTYWGYYQGYTYGNWRHYVVTF